MNRSLAGLLLGVVCAAGAPIDCRKAVTPNERTICADPVLLQSDTRVSTLFDIVPGLVMMGERGNLQQGQREFVRPREACGTDKMCIRAAYEKRAAVFTKILDRVASHGPF